ncbi:hypothetical protein BC828DRAFT_17973 [Blastocladiella britannica]|nr:hypothetical protein BC828DRAFT_17973 [Blastocladiella britannica]
MQVTLELLGVWLICLLSSYRVRVYLQANLSVNRQSYLLAGTAISAITMVLGIVCMVWLLVTTIIDPNYDDSLSDVRRTIIFFAGLMCLITNLVTAGTMFYKVFKIRQRVRNAPLSWTPPLLLLGSNHHLNNGHNNNNENCNGSSGNTVTTDGLHDAPTDAMIAKFNNRSISPMTSLAPKPIRSQQESIRHSSPHSATSPATAATAAAATRASRKPKLIRHVTLALILLGTQIALVIVGATLFASSTKPVPNLMAGALLRVYLLFSIILWRMVVGLYKL